MWNVHRMSIKIEHRNLEIWKTRNDFSVQVRNFLLPLSLKVLRHKERDTHSFYSGFFIPPRPYRATPAQGLCEEAKVNCLLPGQDSTQLTDFIKIPKFSARFRCVTSFALASRFLTPQAPLSSLWRAFQVHTNNNWLHRHLHAPCFFSSLVRSKYVSFVSLSLIFTMSSAGTPKFHKFGRSSFTFFWLTMSRSGLITAIK